MGGKLGPLGGRGVGGRVAGFFFFFFLVIGLIHVPSCVMF